MRSYLASLKAVADDEKTQPELPHEPPPRAWIHPSELPNFAGGPPPLAKRSGSGMRIAAITVTVGLIGGAAAFVLTSRSHPATPILTSATAVAGAPKVIQPTAASMVSLLIKTPGSDTSEAAGLVVDGGSMVITTALITSSSTIDVVTTDKRVLTAAVVKTDSIAGLTFLVPSSALPSPSVTAGSSDPTRVATEVWMTTDPNGVSTIGWSSTTITATDAPVMVNAVGIGTMVDAASSSSTTMAGAALVSPRGELLAIAAPRLGLHHWLPAWMISQLAAALPSQPGHGCLKIEASTAGQGGVDVDSIEAGSPSLGTLQAGDVITAIGSTKIVSISQLLDVLYAMSPGTPVSLTVKRGHAVDHVGVTLSTST